MFITDPHYDTTLALEHARAAHADAAADRLSASPPTLRRAIAASLRRAADRLERGPFALKAAGQC
jgi:hypothetical protein